MAGTAEIENSLVVDEQAGMVRSKDKWRRLKDQEICAGLAALNRMVLNGYDYGRQIVRSTVSHTSPQRIAGYPIVDSREREKPRRDARPPSGNSPSIPAYGKASLCRAAHGLPTFG